jgi:uncharacterized protein HemX
MKVWIWKIAIILVLWLGSVFYAHHRGTESERTAQAQKVEKTVKKHKATRQKVEEQVNELPPAPTTSVGSAPSDSAASELLRNWSRDD